MVSMWWDVRRKTLVHYRPWCHMGGYMIGWQRGIRALPTHVVAQTTIVIRLRTWKAIVGKVR